MTLNEIELDVYRRLDYADQPPTSVKSRIDTFINQRYKALLSIDRMRRFRTGSTVYYVQAGYSEYGLTEGLGRVTRITDLTSQFVLDTWTPQRYRSLDPSAKVPANNKPTTSTPIAWVPLGWGPSLRSPIQPSIGPPMTEYYLNSTVVGDNFTIDLQFVSDTGLIYTVTHTVVGSAGGSHFYTPLDAYDLYSARLTSDRSAASVGDVSLSMGAGAAAVNYPLTIFVIRKNKTSARYYRFALSPTPSTNGSYLVEYERELPSLVSPTDEPVIPSEFHDLLCLMARADEYEFKSDDRFGPLQMQIAKRTMELRQWADNHDAFRFLALPRFGKKRGSGPIIAGPAHAAGSSPAPGDGLTQDEADLLYAKITHAPTHQLGGSDQMSVAGLSGVLASPQVPQAHKITHQAGGVDQVNVTGLSGSLATPQTPTAHHGTHELGGTDAVNVGGLSGVLASPQTPAAHHASHESAGGDKVSIAGLSGQAADPQTPVPHQATHRAGGSDALSVLLLAGFPGGTTTFLRADGTFNAPATPANPAGAVGIIIDGAGSVITTGVKGFIEFPRAGTITAVTLLSSDPAVLSGSIVIDIWKDTYANYQPTVADSIVAAAKPALVSATKYRDTVLTGWTKTINAGDILGFKVDSVTTLTKVTLALTVA